MSKTSHKQFAGVYTAIVTPFTNTGSLDLKAFSKLVDRQLEAGVDGLVVCGSTGEAMTLSDEERFKLVEHCVKHVKGQMPVIAGAGSSSTQVACDLQKHMKDLGANATLQVMPWYNKPTQEGLYRHFAAIAHTNDFPFILYNIPSRTGCDVAVETVLRLAKEFSHIVGLKESNIEAVRLQMMLGELKKIRPDFSVLSGEDGFVLPLLAMGGQGVIAVYSNVAPKEVSEMVALFNKGEMAKAQDLAVRLAELVSLMFFRTNPIPVKSALHWAGLVENTFRLPLCPLNDGDIAYLKSGLEKGGWL